MGQSSLTKIAVNTKLCGVVDMLEGGDVTQRDLDRPERGLCEPHEAQQGQVQGPAPELEQVQLQHKHRVGREWIERGTEKYLGHWMIKSLI